MVATSERVIQATRNALERWPKAHSDLAKAVEESRKPNIRAFADAVAEIRTLIAELRDLENSERAMP